MALVGFFLAAGLAGPHAAVVTHPVGAPANHAALVRPAVPHPASGVIAVNISDQVLPAWSTPGSLTLFWNVSTISVPIDSSVSNQSVMMIAEIGTSAPYTDVPYASWAVPVVTNQTAYWSTVNDTNVLPATAAWVYPPNSWLSDGRYYFTIFFSSPDTSGVEQTGQGTTLSQAGESGTRMMIAAHAPWAALDDPSPTGLPISTGNYTVVASYGGDWVTSASISIANPDGVQVFSAILTQPLGATGVSNYTVVLGGNWLVAETGVYNVTLSDTLSYNTSQHPSNTWNWYSAITVTSSAVYKAVYLNQTTYSNTTGTSTQLISGVGPGPTAAILMVTGVIIGLIVALVLGRMMWGGTAASAAPAQPWSGAKNANECSVCHQTFASEQEMKDHTKSAHGM
ncbi:MAG TPA: hypothetical protein VMH90_01830 [Thermoplasmata archaeon]|nr:hypothetical protein [Thermoplasmata archaeon]